MIKISTVIVVRESWRHFSENFDRIIKVITSSIPGKKQFLFIQLTFIGYTYWHTDSTSSTKLKVSLLFFLNKSYWSTTRPWDDENIWRCTSYQWLKILYDCSKNWLPVFSNLIACLPEIFSCIPSYLPICSNIWVYRKKSLIKSIATD